MGSPSQSPQSQQSAACNAIRVTAPADGQLAPSGGRHSSTTDAGAVCAPTTVCVAPLQSAADWQDEHFTRGKEGKVPRLAASVQSSRGRRETANHLLLKIVIKLARVLERADKLNSPLAGQW